MVLLRLGALLLGFFIFLAGCSSQALFVSTCTPLVSSVCVRCTIGIARTIGMNAWQKDLGALATSPEPTINLYGVLQSLVGP